MFNVNIFWILIIVVYLSNKTAYGFSSLRTNPSLASSANANLQSLLGSENAASNDDNISLLKQQISDDDGGGGGVGGGGGSKLVQHQLQQLMEHSMLSPSSAQYGGKKLLSSQHLPSSPVLLHRTHAGDYLPQASLLREETDRPIYDPGDELIKNYNSDEHDDYIDDSGSSSSGSSSSNNDPDINNKMEFLRKLEEEIRNDQDIVSKSALMMQMLEDPSIETLPIVYVEEPIVPPPSQQIDSSFEMNNYVQGANGVEKRSRYYRRYPWKRHSSRNRGTYEADARYLCVPSKEDVFKLLVGLHENRNGNHHKTVNFCNRKRPAKTIFTNIRFLG